MIRNSGEPTLQETDTTDCSCMELYSRNSKYVQAPRSATLRNHQSHPRVNTNTCARCRKRKPGNPKNPQHCPSCLCPPDVVRSSSGRLRGTENVEEVLARFEEITRDSREAGSAQSPNGRQSVVHAKSVPIRSNPRKSSSLTRQQRKNEHDQMLNALYHDLMSSGLATEETQGCSRYRGPIKSLRKKSLLQTEHSPPPPSGNQEAVDSDAVLRYFRDYKNLEGHPSNILLQKQDSFRQQRGDSRLEGLNVVSRAQNDINEDEQREQFERDKRELNELGQEVREFEMKTGRENCNGDQRWKKHQDTRPNDDGDQLKRKVSFLPSKLPVPMYGNQSTRSRSPPGDHTDKFSINGKIEAKTSYHSTSILDNIGDEEYRENLQHFDYPKESRDSLSQDLKNIPYNDVPYRCLSAPTPQPNKQEERNVTGVPGIHGCQEQCDLPPSLGPSKKYVYAGGDLDLHASKSYIVDLIDRALSRELGTAPEERKIETVGCPSQSQKEICVEIARALQGDCCSVTYTKNSNVQKEAPDYVRHLKVLRWDYLNHIQDELKKLQDLERILDTYSPRQSLPLPQSQTPSQDHKDNHRTIL